MINQTLRNLRLSRNIIMSFRFKFTNIINTHEINKINRMKILDSFVSMKLSKSTIDPNIINENLKLAINTNSLNFLDICEIIKSINPNSINDETIKYLDLFINNNKKLILKESLNKLQKIVFGLCRINVKNEFIRNCFIEAIKKSHTQIFMEGEIRDILSTFSKNQYYHSQNVDLFKIIISKTAKSIDKYRFLNIYFICLDSVKFIESLDAINATKLVSVETITNSIFKCFDEQFSSKYKIIPPREFAGIINIFAKAKLNKDENWKIISEELKKNIDIAIINRENMNKINIVISAYLENLQYFDHVFYENYITRNWNKLKFCNICLIIYTYGQMMKGSRNFWINCEENFLKQLNLKEIDLILRALIGFVNSPFLSLFSKNLWISFNDFLGKADFRFYELNAILINFLKAINKVSLLFDFPFDNGNFKEFFLKITQDKDIHKIIKIYNYLNYYDIKLEPQIKEEIKRYLNNEDFLKIQELNYYIYDEFLINCKSKFEDHILNLIKRNNIPELVNVVYHIQKRKVLISNECYNKIQTFLTILSETLANYSQIDILTKKRIKEIYLSNYIVFNRHTSILINRIIEDLMNSDELN